MTSKKQLKELRGSSAQRAIENCLNAMRTETLSSSHVRNAKRCELCQEIFNFEKFLYHSNPMIEGTAACMLARVAPDKVIKAALVAENLSQLSRILSALEAAECKNIEDLTPLLRGDDNMMVEKAFQTFIAVGRADLLFGLAVGGDDKTTKRVKRYLNEQGFIK